MSVSTTAPFAPICSTSCDHPDSWDRDVHIHDHTLRTRHEIAATHPDSVDDSVAVWVGYSQDVFGPQRPYVGVATSLGASLTIETAIRAHLAIYRNRRARQIGRR